MAQLIIPTPLRKYTENAATFNTDSITIEQAIEELTAEYPDVKQHLLDANGKIRSFIKVFVGEDDIRSLAGEQTELKDTDVVSIVPAIAGGTHDLLLTTHD
ncbi:MAG: MoaD/ThiS family protein [Chitinophagales bacterium]